MAADPKLVKEIFLEAAGLPDGADRAAYLDRACGADAGVRERVEALLRSHDPDGSFLGTPAAVVPDPAHAATDTLSRTSDPPASVTRTAGDEGLPPDDEPLTFLSPATRPDSLGRIGHYEVLQLLGKGGFGIVFRAFDDVLQRVVAVKVLAPFMAVTSPARKRFLREAQSAAKVQHENVVRIIEVGEQPLPYLVMEFIPGETLQQRLDRIGPLDVPDVLRVGRQVAAGLAAAHAQGLIHRDIKPSNILAGGADGQVKITDFGLARAADDASLTRSGTVAGTPMYMAPEQARGEALDHRADLFSLGSVLYAMLTGRPPFRASGTLAVLKRVAEDHPRAIREVIPETPQWLCDIIAKLHEKDPADRYQSAREVADVLADCEAQLRASAGLKDYSRIPRGRPRRPGRRTGVVVAALVLLGLVGIGVAAWKLSGSNPPAGGTDPPPDPASANDLRLAAARPTDLIPFARPDLSDGRWEAQDGKLVHPARDSEGYPGLTLAMRGPDDFDLEAEFERTSGDDFIAFGMSSRGHLFCVALDTWGQWAGLQAVSGELSNVNPTRRAGPWLTTGRRHSLRCEVRAAGVRAWLDAREVVDYRGGYEALSYGRPGLPGWAQFFVQANDNCGFVVHKLVLTPRPPAVVPIADGDPSLAAEEQVKEVRKELMRRNPGFDGPVECKIEDGVVTEVRVVTDHVTDIAPLRVFNALRRLNCSGTSTGGPNGLLADLTPLAGMNLTRLTHLDLSNTRVTDAGLAQFEGCKNLVDVNLFGTKVGDAGLAHLKDSKNLWGLFLAHTRVSDAGLNHFKDCKGLTMLGIDDTRVTDLSLLREMPLKVLWCDFRPERDAEILRSIKTLEKINGQPAAEFWKSVEKK